MKITTFNPLIVTKNAEAAIKLFEELGFKKHHNPEGIGELNVEGIRMKDANGFYLDISQPESSPAQQDVTVIRMNVDNFDEVYQVLLSHGFRNFYGDETVDAYGPYNPFSGGIGLIQHLHYGNFSAFAVVLRVLTIDVFLFLWYP